MGFMGISGIGESDCTADFMSEIADSILPMLKEQLTVITNEFNTPGYIDVALVLKSLISDESEFYFIYGEWQNEIWEPLLKKMNEKEENWNHLRKDYKVLHNFVKEMTEKSRNINN